jgi:phage shock protein PspC (stress-responsive transcriptional regulator)
MIIRVGWVIFPMAWPDPGQQAGAMNTTTADQQTATNPQAGDHDQPQPLCRPAQDRMLAGVGAGIARYLGVDVTVVRIVLAVLAVVGGAGVPIYLAGWLLIPEEGSAQSIASQFIQSRQARSR